jgi:hypothetical protein
MFEIVNIFLCNSWAELNVYFYTHIQACPTQFLPFIQTQSKPTVYLLHFLGTQFLGQPGEACFCTTYLVDDVEDLSRSTIHIL